MGTWKNNDGLYQKYGPTEVVPAVVGEILAGQGDVHQIEVDLTYDLISSATSGNPTIINDTVIVPKNAFIERVQTVCLEAWDSASDNFVLNVGLIRLDRSTEIDYEAFIKALPQASMDPPGDTQEIIIGHTYVGDKVGSVTSTTYPGLITADYSTGAPTAGRSTIRIFYRIL